MNFLENMKFSSNMGQKVAAPPSALGGGVPLKDKPSPKIPKKLSPWQIYHKVNINFFYKLVLVLLLVISRQAQNTQNSMCKSSQYLKKEGRDEIDFLHGDKHQTFLLVDAINLGGHGQTYPNYPK